MSPGVRRGVGAVAAVAVAALVNIATGWFADGAVVWWVSGGVLLVVGIAVQWWLTSPPQDDGARSVSASGQGAVAAGGSARDVSTTFLRRGARRPARRGSGEQAEHPGGVSASGDGSVAAGADATGVRTEVTDDGRPA